MVDKKFLQELLYNTEDFDNCYIESLDKIDSLYIAEVSNHELNEKRIMKAFNFMVLLYRIKLQFNFWTGKVNKTIHKENFQELVKLILYNGEDHSYVRFNADKYSYSLNKYYLSELDIVKNILINSLSNDHSFGYEALRIIPQYKVKAPIPYANDKIRKWEDENKKMFNDIPTEPQKPNEDDYKPIITFSDRLFLRKKAKEEESSIAYKNAINKYEQQYKEWQDKVEQIKNNYNTRRQVELKKYNEYDEKIKKEWQEARTSFFEKIGKLNKDVDIFVNNYLGKDNYSVEDYCSIILDSSKNPLFFINDFDLELRNGILIVEYRLPDISEMPKYKESKIVSGEVRNKEISSTESNKIYDKFIYDITLRTIFELFNSDSANVIESINFNGWVHSKDKATGKDITNCIVSVQVDKATFLDLDLSNVDSKICFKSLKGLSGSKLHLMTPVKPILNIDTNDKRFIEAKEIADNIDDSTNLATMDWEDFEYLVREIFEKEFSVNGGEVKITQASRDGGVDAIAFDPDPIRGGKIVIQAKRYTNTVGVSAVRDLYGTVMNEGAMKGLLVTTSDFGTDSYTFVKDKPITLINGSNLLFLLNKHGIKAKIDINEAKKQM